MKLNFPSECPNRNGNFTESLNDTTGEKHQANIMNSCNEYPIKIRLHRKMQSYVKFKQYQLCVLCVNP